MASLLESLLGSGTVLRPDDKRLVPTRRPLPSRPRDLLELFVTLGAQASMPALFQSCDLRQADPRQLTYVALGRWPTLEELAAIASPYEAKKHLRDLLLGEEFRRCLLWRICDAYPERQRLFYVRIPRCAGGHFLHMAGSMHPLFPPGLGRWTRQDRGDFVTALGTYLGRFDTTKTIHVASPSLAPFVQAAPAASADPILPWGAQPPRRTGDRMFVIVREPAGLILSQVNATLAGLAAGGAGQAADEWRGRLGPLPRSGDTAGWKAAGRRVLAKLAVRNPICHALGDGTARAALQACRLSDLEIVDLSRYAEWVTYTWNVEPEPAMNAAPPLLTRRDLDAADSDRLTGLVAEDLAFYEPLAARLATLPDMKVMLRGGEL